MQRTSNPIDCPACELPHELPELEPGSTARCSRCGAEITRNRTATKSHLAALSITALILWCLSLWLPLAGVKKVGISNNGYLIDLGSSYRESGQILLGWTVDCFALILPSVLFLFVPIVVFSKQSFRLGQLCSFAKKWAMPEVFMLSILISFTKIGALAKASLGLGFWTLTAATLLMTYILGRIELPKIEGRKSHAAAWSFLFAACFVLIPANLLPIMLVKSGGHTHNSTIIGGISDLTLGGMWGIALIVFVASILVPFCKLGGLAWLLLASRKKAGTRKSIKLYNTLNFIGRWSMLDIFLIGVLASLIEFGKLAYISPGPGAPAFAAAVVLTIIAVEQFDTRTLFSNPQKATIAPSQTQLL